MNYYNFYKDKTIDDLSVDDLYIAQFQLRSQIEITSYKENYYQDMIFLYNEICDEIYLLEQKEENRYGRKSE